MRDTGSGMIPCRRNPASGGIIVASKPSGWAPSRNLLASAILAAGLLLSIALTSRAPMGLSLDLLPASPSSSRVRYTLELEQQQRQRYERHGLHAPASADAVWVKRVVSATVEQPEDEEEEEQGDQQRPEQEPGSGARGGGGESELGEEAAQQQDEQQALTQHSVQQQQQDEQDEQPTQQHKARKQAKQRQQPQAEHQAQPAEQPTEQPAEQHSLLQPLPQADQVQPEQLFEAGTLQSGIVQAEQQAEQQQEVAPAGGPSPYQQAVAACRDLACLTEAAKQPRAPGQFLFPHFFVIGWQKCATTSLFFHLRDRHPQVMATMTKEPEFFTDACAFQPHACPAAAQEQYIHSTLRQGEIVAGGMAQAGGEASTHYGRNGHLLAQGVHQVFPWLKIVASMREPISRSISMLAHNLDKHSKGCLAKRRAYSCLLKTLSISNYSQPFQAWLDAFPAPQVLLVQYENLTSDTHGKEVLRHVKTFLDLDPALPIGEDSIGHNNSRAARMERMGELAPGEQPQGWPMKQWQYEQLVDLVRPDAERMADIADRYGFADRAGWLANWEAEWQSTLNDCHKGWCDVYPN